MRPPLTEAAGRIFDVMSGGRIDWRSRVAEDQDDGLFESADWQMAVAYAEAALGAQPSLSNEGER